MKIYTQTFDVAKQSPHRFWVAPFSDFKIGVKIVKNGTPIDNEFTVKKGTTTLTPDDDLVDGFKTYTIKSGSTGSEEYAIEISGVGETQKLIQIITDSTVFDIDAAGGDIPADVATQTWVNSQISGFITDDALTAYVPLSGNANMTGSLSVTNNFSGVKLQSNDGITIWDVDEGNTKYANFDYDGLYVKNYNESTAKEITYPTKGGTMLVDTDLTAYYTKSETSSAIEISNGLIGKVTGGAETGTTGTPAAIQAIKSVYETDWATLSATAISSTFYVIVADPA